MYYLGLLLFLCSTAFSQIEYSENKDASVVAVHGSANGAFMITAGEELQFYWSTEEGTTECTSPTTLTLAVSTLIFDVHVEGDILSLLLLSNNRLHIVTFVVTDLGLQPDYVCTGYQDWTDKVMKGKPMWAYFLPGTDSETASSGNLFAYSDTKRVLVFMSYTLVGGQIVTGWNVTESLITVDSTVGIDNGPINDYATPRFSYDATQNLVVYLDKSGKVYTADVSRVLAKQATFTNIVFNPDTHNVQKVLEIRLEPSLKSLMLSVTTSTCGSAMVVLDYTTSAPGALSFNTIDTDCTTRLPLSDGNNFYYQSSKDLYQVQGGASSVYFSTNDATIIYDYDFYAPGKALVITKNQNTFVCNIYSVEASQQSTPFTAIPFLSTELFKWQMVYDSTGGLKGALFWTTVATIYGYGFGDANYEVTLALDNPKDFTVINLQDEDAGILASRSYLAIAEGSDQGVELFVTIFWDYSNLVLPIVNGTTKDSFYFPDFITALTRVKNEVSSIFSSYIDLGDVSAIDEWSPELWEPYPGGLSLNITFTQGETDEKIATILTSMANEIGVTVERECEFQDFLSCDVLTLWHSYAPESETLTTNGIVTFYVNGVCSALPSVLALFVVTVLYTLVSF